MAVDELSARAQTNIQLYNQLSERGFSGAELQAIKRAYTASAELFAGQIRPEGRPFTCHLVGVASILGHLGEPLATLCAGLLHSVYVQGDFGAGKGVVTGSARRELEGVGDSRVRDLIEKYEACAWNAANVRRWAANAAAIDGTLRTVILIWLADALDDALDHGLHYSTKGEKHARAIPREDIVALARALGREQLADALATAFEETDRTETFHRMREERAGSVVQGPKSYGPRHFPRVKARLHAFAQRVMRRLYRG